MVDVDTFLTILYVMADDFFKTTLLPGLPGTPGCPEPERGCDLGPVRQWQSFGSERAFTAMPSVISGPPFRLCPPGSSSTGKSASSTWPSWHFVCILSGSWPPSAAPMKPWIAPAFPPGMPSAEEPDGCQDWPTLAGATGWAGMKASMCSWRSTHGA